MSKHRQPDQDFDTQASERLRAALRERARETPSPEIDARVLAAARRSVGSGPQATAAKPRRWFRMIDTPFATAAIVLVSASLLLLMREQGHFDRSDVNEYRQDGGQATATAVPAEAAPPPASSSPTPTEAAAESSPHSEVIAPAQTQGRVEGKSDGREQETDKLGELARAATNAVGNSAQGAHAEAAGATDSAAPVAPPAEPSQPVLRDEAKQRASMPDSEAFPASPTTAIGTAGSTEAPPGTAVERRAQTVSDDDLLKKNSDTRAQAQPAVTRKVQAETKAQPEGGGSAMREAVQQPEIPPAAGDAALAAPAAAVSPNESHTAERLKSKDEISTEPAPMTGQERLLQEIRQLIKSGKFSDAQLALRRFTKTYPGARIPADILASLKPAD